MPSDNPSATTRNSADFSISARTAVAHAVENFRLPFSKLAFGYSWSAHKEIAAEPSAPGRTGQCCQSFNGWLGRGQQRPNRLLWRRPKSESSASRDSRSRLLSASIFRC